MIQTKLTTFLALGAILTIALVILALIGVDVSATSQPPWVERQIATTFLSLKIRLARPDMAPRRFDANDVQRGLELYQPNCAFCHGSASGKPGAYAESLSPRPPQFFRRGYAGLAWRSAFIIRRGVRWTGMPAFGALNEDDIWRIATMLETKPGQQHEEAH
jgi:mono/diheme cytochrome c family protein